ncbi:uncharacterized protein LOC21404192 [Morus notabilis]|uniref:uncharacterized protein LOC21404192 n=1 Tax=Morus notabilis TaxID=981085 RepID=UPI000CED47C0|nr:uncharacterized protein LOC21404192 [Morus notabilis]
MERKHQHGLLPILSVIVTIFLGALSVTSCIAAEFKRAKINDLRLDGRFCYMPGSHSFGFGIGALVCLCIAQIIANMLVCRNCCTREMTSSCKAKTPMISTLLLLISWISFGIAVILLGSATSMSIRQPYGKGWLNGDCYVVKDGVFFGSAILVLLTIGFMLGSAVTSKTRRKTQIDQEFTLQQQLDPKFIA